MKLIAGFAMAAVMAGPAVGQHVGACEGWLASAWTLAEPWEDNSRTFSNGAVRLALIDAVEPGAVPFHLLVLSPPYDELGVRQCKVVSFEEGFGFHAVYFDELTADYDPATGLIFEVPVEIYVSDLNILVRGLELTLNQATGAIATDLLTE